MSIYRFAWILVCVLGISIGQILFKLAAINFQPNQSPWRMIFNPYLVTAGLIYVLATFMWVWQLRYVPINQAYPIFSLAFIIVPILGWIFLSERVQLSYILGVILIVAGTSLATLKY